MSAPAPQPELEISLRAFKSRFYLVALPSAIAGSLVVWMLKRAAATITPFDQVAFPALAGALFLVLILTVYGVVRRRGERFMARLEYLVLGGTLLFFLARQFYLFYPGYKLGKATDELLSITHWEALVYVLIFLILPRVTALRLSMVFLGLWMALGLGHIVPEALAGEDLHELNYLAQSALSGASMTALLYILGLLKERYAVTVAHAESMAQLAMTDFLTGIPNRRQMTDVLEREIALALRHGLPFAVIIFDLDHFKRVNDRFGHETGDRMLRGVVTLVKGDLRASDWLGRWGGEEFLIVAPQTTTDQAALLADRLREKLARHQLDRIDTLTATFGVAGYVLGDSAETLVKRADDAMYHGKTAGRNRVEVGQLVG